MEDVATVKVAFQERTRTNEVSSLTLQYEFQLFVISWHSNRLATDHPERIQSLSYFTVVEQVIRVFMCDWQVGLRGISMKLKRRQEVKIKAV